MVVLNYASVNSANVCFRLSRLNMLIHGYLKQMKLRNEDWGYSSVFGSVSSTAIIMRIMMVRSDCEVGLTPENSDKRLTELGA